VSAFRYVRDKADLVVVLRAMRSRNAISNTSKFGLKDVWNKTNLFDSSEGNEIEKRDFEYE